MAIDVQGMVPLIQVFDMPASVHFYCDILGFQIVTSDGKPAPHFDWVWLRLNDADIMLNTAYESDRRPSSPTASRVAAHRDTSFYFGCSGLDRVFAYLREQGVAAKAPRFVSYGMNQLYVTDPDGYVLCFQHRVNP